MKPKDMIKKCHEIFDKEKFANPSNVELPLNVRVQMLVDRLKSEIGLVNSFREESDALHAEMRRLRKNNEALAAKNAKLTSEVIKLSGK